MFVSRPDLLLLPQAETLLHSSQNCLSETFFPATNLTLKEEQKPKTNRRHGLPHSHKHSDVIYLTVEHCQPLSSASFNSSQQESAGGGVEQTNRRRRATTKWPTDVGRPPAPGLMASSVSRSPKGGKVSLASGGLLKSL